MTLKRFFSVLTCAVLSALCLSSCIETDPVDIDSEDYVFGYTYSYDNYVAEMKPVMEGVANHYMTALKTIPQYTELTDHTFKLKGVRLYDAYDKVIEVLQAASKELKANPIPGTESLKYPFSFDVKYTTNSGITALAFSHGFNAATE